MEHTQARSSRRFWLKGAVPQDFKTVSVIHLYKGKGNGAICNSHHGISLLSIAGNILARIVLNRMLVEVFDSAYLAEELVIFSVRQFLEKCREQKMDRNMVFFDLTKAFITVNRDGLWTILQSLGLFRS